MLTEVEGGLECRVEEGDDECLCGPEVGIVVHLPDLPLVSSFPQEERCTSALEIDGEADPSNTMNCSGRCTAPRSAVTGGGGRGRGGD